MVAQVLQSLPLTCEIWMALLDAGFDLAIVDI